MPMVIIHTTPSMSLEKRKSLVAEVRKTIPEILGVPDHIGQVILYESSLENRCSHASRDQGFVFVEITMYKGRTRELKETFLKKLISVIHFYTGIDPADINCVIREISSENMLGGVSHEFIRKMNDNGGK
ncbi:MAG: tautomerase family protein [Desulfobacula sp.]|jgi:phenylpyruvate tautomerase PptA (4-oxalocrotonate tautomerase family)